MGLASKSDQWAKGLASKCDPQDHTWWEERTNSHKVSFDVHIHKERENKFNFKIFLKSKLVFFTV